MKHGGEAVNDTRAGAGGATDTVRAWDTRAEDRQERGVHAAGLRGARQRETGERERQRLQTKTPFSLLRAEILKT